MKEKIYDEQIAPLMVQIIEICKSGKIAMLADFSLDEDLHCTSALLQDEFGPSHGQLRALEILQPKEEMFALSETTETLPDGTKRITIGRIR